MRRGIVTVWSAVLATGFVAFGSLGQASAQDRPEVWEKLVVPGLTYRQEIDRTVPRVTHAFRMNLGAPGVKLVPHLAQGKVYENDETKGRGVLSQALRETGAIAGVNAGFFGPSGDPLGAHIFNKEIISVPWPDRTVFAWGPKGGRVAQMRWSGRIVAGSVRIPLDGINQSCVANEAILNSGWAGQALSGGPTDLVHVVMDASGPLLLNQNVKAKVKMVVTNQKDVTISDGQFVLSAHGAKGNQAKTLRPGQDITIRVDQSGVDLAQTPHVMGCGNRLIEKGQIGIRYASERFNDAFGAARHPRTAVGVTATGEIWLVVVDGRQPMSAGATLAEMATVMQRLNCVEALCLDGGGSSTAGVGQVVVNRPSDGRERAVTNFLLVMASGLNPPGAERFEIQAPEQIAAGTTAKVVLRDEEGAAVPDSEVFWSAMGAGWIDQSGLLTLMTPGDVRIAAWVRGVRVETVISVPGEATTPPVGRR